MRFETSHRYYSSYDENNPDYADFSKEMNALVPDTATMVKQMQAELGIKRNKDRLNGLFSKAVRDIALIICLPGETKQPT